MTQDTEEQVTRLCEINLGEFPNITPQSLEATLIFNFDKVQLKKKLKFELDVSEQDLRDLLYMGKHYDLLTNRLQEDINDKLKKVTEDDNTTQRDAVRAYMKYVTTCINIYIKTKNTEYLDFAILKYKESKANKGIHNPWARGFSKDYVLNTIIFPMATTYIWPCSFWLDELKASYIEGFSETKGTSLYEACVADLRDMMREASISKADS